MKDHTQKPPCSEAAPADSLPPLCNRSDKPSGTVFWFRYLPALAALALVCGLVGAAFTLLLNAVEHLVFGFHTGTFSEAVTRVPPLHRFAAVAIAGVGIALVWYLFRRYGPQIPSPAEIYAGKRISLRWMAADTSLQIVNVAAGGSIGREGAPRQLGALLGARAASVLGLDPCLCRILIASGTGAGLAAIYNVPLGGTLFAIEVITGLRVLRSGLRTALTTVGSALFTAWVATVVARIAVPDRPTYAVDWQALDAPLICVALLAGPLGGALGFGFATLMDRLRARAPQGAALLWTMPLCYLLLAALAVPLPLVLGNGHAMAQDVFSLEVSLTTAALLVFAKPLATLLTVRAGATGGRLTPSLATGAALGILLAAACSTLVPVPPTAVAILTAAAFLAGAMRAPLTACVLALEFTGAATALWPLAALSVGGAAAVSFLLTRRGLAKS